MLLALLSAAIFLVPAANAGLFGYQGLITPDRMQGRAQGALMFLTGGIRPLAPVLGGFLLARLGARPALLAFGGVFALAAVLLTVSRPIRAIPLLAEVAEHPAR